MAPSLPLRRSFEEALESAGARPLRPVAPAVLQMNLGKRCNQACRHCHVGAGPERTEMMRPEVIDACFRALDGAAVPTVDLTGGAPELHPQFREIVQRARAAGRHVIDRCNLTVMRLPAYADLPEFLAGCGVEVIASLPSFGLRQTDAQRGKGVFERSIAALRRFAATSFISAT